MIEELIKRIPIPEELGTDQKPQVKALTSDEMRDWYMHLASDHVPHRRDCVICQQGAGRDRPRRLQEHQSCFELSLDIAGPLKVAKDQDRRDVKYFLVGAMRIPYIENMGPLIEGGKPSDLS